MDKMLQVISITLAFSVVVLLILMIFSFHDLSENEMIRLGGMSLLAAILFACLTTLRRRKKDQDTVR